MGRPTLPSRPPTITPLEKRLMLDASLTVLSGQVLWLDAADKTTVKDTDGDTAATGTGGANNGFSGNVATWMDKSGSGFNVTAPAVSSQPSYANTLNGLNVITFDGTNDILQNTTASIAGSNLTTFIVWERTNAGAVRNAVFEIGSGTSRNGLYYYNTANKLSYYQSGTFYNYTTNYVPGNYEVLNLAQIGTSITGRVNGVSDLSTTGTARTNTTGIFLADDSTGGDSMQGRIAEMIVYNRALTADERHDVENYLAGKWGQTMTNTAPIIATNGGATVLQGSNVTIANTALSSTDVDNSEAMLQYKLTALPTYGTLTNTNTLHTYTLGEYFTQGDIDSGYIRYTHNNTPNFSDSFSFTLSDQVATTAANTFSLTITPSNHAPTIQGWTLVSSENFESGATGWSINTTENGGTYLTSFLGRRSQEGGAQNTFKTYTMTGTQDYTVVIFDMYKIDSWDGENFKIFVNDTNIINIPLIQTSFNAPADGTSGIVSYTVQEMTPFQANFAYGSWNDQIFRFTLTISNAAAANLKLGFSSTLDQAITDEAWGVDNINIYEAKAGGVPGPIGIIENSVNGTVVGKITATDQDVGQTVTYSIVGGTGTSAFSINSTTGVITVANAALLDYETTPSFTLDIRATDNGVPSYSDTKTITINILDLPENTAPTINALGPLTVAENAANNTVLGTITGSDAQSNTITWSITGGNTDNIFAINSSTGAIRVSSNTNLNYDYRASYTLTITGTDNGFGNLTASRNVIVNVTNVNEAPTFNIPQSFLNQNPYLRYSAATGNFYQFVSTASNYTTASTAATAAMLNGIAGHLVTVTSAAENTYVRALGSGNIWLGATDSITEGTWVWGGTGIEAGQTFWLGNASGSAQNGFYTNWLATNPDNASNEDHLEMQASGQWNDVLNTTTRGYVIEWEGAAVMAALGNGPFTLAENPSNGQVVGSVHARDADAGDTLAYSITGGTGASYFAINATTGQITVTNPSAINYEAATSYTLTTRVQDAGGLFDTQTVTINITDVNETPVLNTNTGVTLNEGASVVVTNAMLSSSDVDAPPDSVLLYTLTDAVDNGTLVNTNTSSTLGLGSTFTQGDIDAGYIRYTHSGSETVSDGFSFTISDGAITLPAATFNITVNPVNDAPVIQGWTLVSSENFESGATGWVNNITETSAPYLTQFLGRGSNDGGLQTNYKTYALSGNQSKAVIVFDFYEIDSWDSENFQVFVNDVNVITQAFSQNLTDTPANGSNGAASWTVQKLTPFSTNLGFAGTPDQMYRYILTINTTGNAVKLGFGSTLNEGAANEAWGVDNINVYEVGGTGTPGPMQIAENSANGTPVGSVVATDAENNTLTYAVTGGTGASVFSINSTTGAITVSNGTLLNYEATTSYTLDVRVTDNGSPNLSDTKTITINVVNLPENTAPVITNAGTFTVAENVANNTLVGTVAATDAEANTLTYSIISGNTDNLFSINGSGQIRIANNNYLNYEYLNNYTLSVRVTDNGFGTLSDTKNFTINIANVNEAPSFNPVQALLNSDPALRYNAATGNFYKLIPTTLTYAAAETAAAATLLNGVGGYIAAAETSAENAYLATLITTNTWINGGDAAIEGTWVYTSGPNAGQIFWIGTATGSAQNGFYTNWSGGEPNNSSNEDSMELRTNGQWNDINSASPHPYLVEWDGAAVIANLVNGPYSVNENSIAGTALGTARASDPDIGDTKTFSITGGTGAGLFAINATTGQITLTGVVNYEAVSSYTLNLRVQDTAGLFDTQTVTVNINDVNETPVLDVNTGVTLNEGANVIITNAMLKSSDVDTPPDTLLVYTLTSETINGILYNAGTGQSIRIGQTFTQGDIDTGRIRYTHNDGETTSDTFSFTVSDGAITLPAATFNITVNTVNEAPSFSAIQALLNADSSLLYNSTTGHFYKYMPYFANIDIAQAKSASMTLNGVAGYVAQSNSAYENAYLLSLAGGNALWLGGSDAGVEGTWVYDHGAEAGQAFWQGTATGAAQNGNYTNWNSGEPNQAGNEDYIQMFGSGLWNDTSGGSSPFVVEWDGADVLAGTANGPYSINENSALNSVVGSAIAHDYDAGNTLTYAITGGTGAGVFTINASTGQIRLNSPVNYEAVSSYTLDLRVQDNGGLFDTLTITININDINDVPDALSLAGNRIEENSSIGTLIGTLSTVDQDPADTHIYSLVTNPGGKFVIVGNELRTAGDIDYERNQSFAISISTDDGRGGVLIRNFTIGVDDVMDTFTPPPGPDPTGGAAYVPERETTDTGPSINILSASLNDTGKGYGGFFGEQILRNNLTIPLRSLQTGTDIGHIDQEELGTILSRQTFLSPEIVLPQVQELDRTIQSYTNLREAIAFLQQIADSHEHETIKNDEPALRERAQSLPADTLDQRFVDVMTYHKDRAARLRAAFLQDNAA